MKAIPLTTPTAIIPLPLLHPYFAHGSSTEITWSSWSPMITLGLADIITDETGVFPFSPTFMSFLVLAVELMRSFNVLLSFRYESEVAAVGWESGSVTLAIVVAPVVGWDDDVGSVVEVSKECSRPWPIGPVIRGLIILLEQFKGNT